MENEDRWTKLTQVAQRFYNFNTVKMFKKLTKMKRFSLKPQNNNLKSVFLLKINLKVMMFWILSVLAI
jgi:N-acetylneuraminic acid mutarotase